MIFTTLRYSLLFSTTLLASLAQAQESHSPQALAWGDFDADGLMDAAAVGTQGRVTLLRNAGDGSLEDVTQQYEIDVDGASVLAWGDYDGDGLEDLFVGTTRGNSLLLKNLGATFVDVAERVGIDHEAHDLLGEWLDWDANGELDLHVMTTSGILLYHARAGVFLPAHLPGPASPSTWYQPGLSAASDAEVEPAAADSTRGSQPTRRGGSSTSTTLGSSTPGGTLTGGTASPSGAGTAPELGATNCPIGLDNASAPGNCISASTVPTLGSLYPITAELFVDATTGYVGLGTTSPTDNLHASSAGDVVLRLEADTDNANELDNARIQFSQDGGGTLGRVGFGGVAPNDFVLMSETPNSEVVLGTDDTERLRVDSTGNIGIGTNSPLSLLHAASTGNAILTLEADTDNDVSETDHARIDFSQDDGATLGRVGFGISGTNHFVLMTETSNTEVVLGTNNAERVRIDSSGNVGIGTDTPTATIHASRSVGDLDLLLEADVDDDDENDHPKLRLRQDGGETSAFIGFGASENHLKIVTNGANDSDIILLAGSGGPGEFDLKIDKGTGLVSVKHSLEIRGGADIVERFESSCGELEPGTVVAIDPEHPGALICSYEAYDTKVAGVVSGAGGVNPGICLGQDGVLDGDTPVAMTGRIYVKCSAENGAIRAGDRLTTAGLAGHAMKVTDELRAGGTVIGKAMSELDESTGLVLVLVNLQ